MVVLVVVMIINKRYQTIIIETKKEIYMKKDKKASRKIKNCSAKSKSDCKCTKTKDCN